MNNERSLAKEITEGFEALKSMRNNEPVAWMATIGEDTVVTDDSEFVLKMWQHNGYAIQELYTHPVKELTDEEIAEVFDNTFKVRDFEDAFLKFARAILRKAQEK